MVKGIYNLKKRLFSLKRKHTKQFILFGTIVFLLLLTSCTLESETTTETAQNVNQETINNTEIRKTRTRTTCKTFQFRSCNGRTSSRWGHIKTHRWKKSTFNW